MSRSDCPAIVCLSHLDWNFVWQRPQHILSRLAQRYPVIFMHEPLIDPDPESRLTLEQIADSNGVTAWQPTFPDRPDVIVPWRNVYVDLVKRLLIDQGWLEQNGNEIVATRPLIGWFYTPVPAYFTEQLPFDLIVYDVMDELANFKHAAQDLREREAKLLHAADLVFTGGRSLYDSRKDRHPHVHLFASGVDAAHFAQALDPATPLALELVDLPRPVLGYYGVIDERIDLDLLRIVAEQQPNWSIVMVGPVKKIEQTDLPHAPNLHYLGQQDYARLPQLLKGFDVCLMPFAINQATRFISPTKTLEYIAAHKLIVSTPVPDVVANWSEIVRIAATPEAFAAAVAAALAESDAERTARIVREDQVIARNSWDGIAATMHELIERALHRRTTVPES